MEGLLFIIVFFVIPYWLLSAYCRLHREKREAEEEKKKLSRLDRTYKYASRYNNNKFKGDAYERCIGRLFEGKGYYVIYHGLRKNYQDKGVDLIAFSGEKRILALVQCKNWKNTLLDIYTVRLISKRMDDFIAEGLTKAIMLDGIRKALHDDHVENIPLETSRVKRVKEVILSRRKVSRRYNTLKLIYLSAPNIENDLFQSLEKKKENHYIFNNDIEIIVRPITN